MPDGVLLSEELALGLREMLRQWEQQGRRLDVGRRQAHAPAPGTSPIVQAIEVTSATPDSDGYPAKIQTFDGTTWSDTYDEVRAVKIGGGTLSTGFYPPGRLMRVASSGKHAYGIHPGVGGIEVKGLTFTSDTDSFADSDPGNGLFKWNSATQSAATQLYFDNQTADAVSVATFFASLAPGGLGQLFLQQSDDPTRWQLWEWSTVTNGTGYYKFAVSQLAFGADIADAKTVYCLFFGLPDASASRPGIINLVNQYFGAGRKDVDSLGIAGAWLFASESLASGSTPCTTFSANGSAGRFIAEQGGRLGLADLSENIVEFQCGGAGNLLVSGITSAGAGTDYVFATLANPAGSGFTANGTAIYAPGECVSSVRFSVGANYDTRAQGQSGTILYGGTATGGIVTALGSALSSANISDFTEAAQDAVGASFVDSATIDFTYDDAANTITAVVIANSISNSLLRDSGACSVIGRSANTAGDPADIAAAANDTVLRRVSDALSFGQLTVGMAADDLWTYAKIQNVSATDRLLGRDTAGAGDIEELTVGGGLEFTGAGGIQRSALTGDVTAAAGSNATTIANDAVTYAKLQNVSASRLLGRYSGTAGDCQEIALSLLTMSSGTLSPDQASDSTLGVVRPATQAEIEAENSSACLVVEARRARYIPGVAKAWVNFNGTGTVAINSSYNVSSITDNGTGDYTVNFTTAFSAADAYAGVATAGRNGAGIGIRITEGPHQAAQSTTAWRFVVHDGAATQDAERVAASFYGDQ